MGQPQPDPFAAAVAVLGKDCEGNWVVHGLQGRYGGFFANRAEALRFAMFENGYPNAAVMVPAILELNMTQRR